LADAESIAAVEVAERFADGRATNDERLTAMRAVREEVQDEDEVVLHTIIREDRFQDHPARSANGFEAFLAAIYTFNDCLRIAFREGEDETSKDAHSLAQCSILRDIFGDPFRPVPVDPSWRSGNVVSLAEAIYADRAFDRLPILADALEDAGCDQADILEHCRGPGPHVRGCWVVDLILGKE
jgi:hypothetical protein